MRSDLQDVAGAPLIFPDPIVSADQISAAAYLYFTRPIVFPTPRLLILPEAEEVLQAIESRRPVFADQFFRVFATYRAQVMASREAIELLSPLRDAFMRVHLVYAGNEAAFEDAAALASATGMSLDAIASICGMGQSCGELVYHLVVETYLELNQDIDATFKYCEELFSREPLPHLLAKAYLMRLRAVRGFLSGPMPVLLTNPALLTLLERLPIEGERESTLDEQHDLIAWQLFRTILSPYVDPLAGARIQNVAEIRSQREAEVARLRRKCSSIAAELDPPTNPLEAADYIKRYVEQNVAEEVQDVLRVNQDAVRALFREIATDQKAWLAVIGGGLATVQGLLSGGAALAAIAAYVGPRMAKALLDRRDKLRTSDFALVYSVARKPLVTVRQ
jgi:hypothetical protein